MTYLFLFFLILQTADQINITILDAQEKPVPGNRISLTSEQGQIVADCTTGSNGSCTILVEEITTSGSGLIRGVLDIPSRGRRSVIWPGGILEITIKLDENGQIFVPSDHYITPTPELTAGPTPEHTAGPTPEHTATPTPEHTATPTPEHTAGPTSDHYITPTSEHTAGPTPESVEDFDTPTEDRSFFYKILFILIFLLILSFFTIFILTKVKR